MATAWKACLSGVHEAPSPPQAPELHEKLKGGKTKIKGCGQSF